MTHVTDGIKWISGYWRVVRRRKIVATFTKYLEAEQYWNATK
jgi:hypothetical protein